MMNVEERLEKIQCGHISKEEARQDVQKKMLAFADSVDVEETTTTSRKVAILRKSTVRFHAPKGAYDNFFFLFRTSARTDILTFD